MVVFLFHYQRIKPDFNCVYIYLKKKYSSSAWASFHLIIKDLCRMYSWKQAAHVAMWNNKNKYVWQKLAVSVSVTHSVFSTKKTQCFGVSNKIPGSNHSYTNVCQKILMYVCYSDYLYFKKRLKKYFTIFITETYTKTKNDILPSFAFSQIISHHEGSKLP